MSRLLTSRERIHAPAREQSAGVRTQKKMDTWAWKYTIIWHTMSNASWRGGLARVAGQSCLAGPSVLRLHPRFGHRPGWVYGRELRPERHAFLCGATNFFTPQATSLVVALLPPASLLALSPHRPPLTATSISVSALHLQEPASRLDKE